MQNLDTAPPAYKLWHAFATRGTYDESIRNRFKLIGRVENWKEVGACVSLQPGLSLATEQTLLRQRHPLISIRSGLPGLLETYNGKPTIIYKTGELALGAVRQADGRSPVFSSSPEPDSHPSPGAPLPLQNFFEVGINVHVFRYIARKTLYSFREQMHSMVAKICGTVEGRTDDGTA